MGCVRGVIAFAPEAIDEMGVIVPDVLVYLYDAQGRLQMGRAGLPRAFAMPASRLVLEAVEGVSLPPWGFDLYPACQDCAGLGLEDAGRGGISSSSGRLVACRGCGGRGHAKFMSRINGGVSDGQTG